MNRMRDVASGLLAGGDVSFSVTSQPEVLDLGLPPEIRKDLLLTIKEGLTNAVKHSGCSRIRIMLGKEGARLTVVLEDDGRGLDAKQGSGGHGLANMRGRIEGIGGRLRIEAGRPSGTILLIDVPVG